MNSILIISANTFKETIRNKVLYNILLVAGVALFLSMAFGDLSVFSRAQVMADFGLATMSLTGLLLAVFIGVGMLGREISSKTVYSVLTRPVTRESFILGKFFGLFATLMMNFALISVVFFIFISLLGTSVKPSLSWAVVLTAAEMAVMISAAIFFSSFTTPTLAAIFSISFYVAGHLNNMIGIGAEQQNSVIWRTILKLLYFAFPNLDHFNIRARVVYELSIPEGYIAGALLYGLLYTTLLLSLSILFFSRKDL
ncbi:MAG: ABC transporter permease subunit [Fibrobacter sp.]|nr:ABC transporter permease subunit [Fibrobacter sp.]